MTQSATIGQILPAHALAVSYATAIDSADRALSMAVALRSGWQKLRCPASLERYRDSRAAWHAAAAALAAARPAAASSTAQAQVCLLRAAVQAAAAGRVGQQAASRVGQQAASRVGQPRCERESFSITQLLRAARNNTIIKRHDRATIKARATMARSEADLVGWNRDRWRAAKVYSDRIAAARPVRNSMTGPNNPDRENWRTVKRAPALALDWATEHRVSTRAVTAIPLPDPTEKQRARASNANGVPKVIVGHGSTARHRVVLPDPVDAEHQARRLTRRERKNIKR